MESDPELSILKGPTRNFKPQCIHKLFENVVTKDVANKIALIFEDEETQETRKYTYFELNKVTNQLARVISQTVIDKQLSRNNDGDYIIAVSMKPSDNLIITLLSILKSGAAYLPLDPSFPKPRVEHILTESEPVMVIFDDDTGNFENAFKLSLNSFLRLGESFPSSKIKDQEQLTHFVDDLAIVLYTSGSTGIPKGVRIPHTTILNRLQWQFNVFPYNKSETTCIFKTALTFVDSVSEIWGPLLNGISLLVLPGIVVKDVEKLVSVLEKYKIQRFVLVPSLLKSILMYLDTRKEKRVLENLKMWICSGEVLVSSLAKQFYQNFADKDHRLCNFYGSTEIMGDVTYYVTKSLEEINTLENVPIGSPVDNTIVYLLDSEFRPVKVGDVGEILISGANLTAGYVNGRNSEKFIKNSLSVDPMFSKLFRTGDFARIENGVLVYEGRTDSQIKVRGYRVDLAEIEKSVNAIEGVNKGVVLCYKPGETCQAILAFVMADTSLNEYLIENILKKYLPDYMIPRVLLVNYIPLLVNGKTDRQALLKYYEDLNNNSCYVELDYTGIAGSQISAAKVLFETISLVLDKSVRSAISVEANFYDIGGNSLNTVCTVIRLNEKGYHLSISDFISSSNLGDILDIIAPHKQSYPRLLKKVPCYIAEELQEKHKDDVFNMMKKHYTPTKDLEQWITPKITGDDYIEIVNDYWDILMEEKLSFVVKTETGGIVGVALNADGREPDCGYYPKFVILEEFLESLENPIRDRQLPQGRGNVLYAILMITSQFLTSKENVSVIQFMEKEQIRLARNKGFLGIFTTNTSPLTQQLCTDVYGYKTLLDYQVNQYVASDNTKPFGSAPDSQRVLLQWKTV